jgi:8-oxo-dGTP pyrophosphatase MutT (NUDIX family)
MDPRVLCTTGSQRFDFTLLKTAPWCKMDFDPSSIFTNDLMRQPSKKRIASALSMPGFEDWQPRFDVPDLQRPRTRPDDLPGQGRVAAVMILMYPNLRQPAADETPQLVLTKRHAKLSKHAGQISFPGGRQDPGESLEQTALRETFEEIGIAQHQIEILGQLNSVYIPPSDFTVTPFVGWYDDQPQFILAPEEVDEVIEASLTRLLHPETLVVGDVRIEDGRILTAPHYQIGAHQVWGATAIILSELIERLSQVEL